MVFHGIGECKLSHRAALRAIAARPSDRGLIESSMRVLSPGPTALEIEASVVVSLRRAKKAVLPALGKGAESPASVPEARP
jgi:hypothetical protein